MWTQQKDKMIRFICLMFVLLGFLIVYQKSDGNYIPFKDFKQKKHDASEVVKENELDKAKCPQRTQVFVGNKRANFIKITKQNKHCYMKVLDIMKQPTIEFLPHMKNPCWYGNKSNGPFRDDELHCLPYFYIIGVRKSGTTDLHSRIQRHPEFCGSRFKESHWLARVRFGIWPNLANVRKKISYAFEKGYDNMDLKFYSSFYDSARKCLSTGDTTEEMKTQYRSITADAAPSNYDMHTYWELLPGNEGLDEPKYTNFHYIKHLIPKVKIIIIMRDPVSRLYSDFNVGMRRLPSHLNTPETFHKHVTTTIAAYRTCFKQNSVRACVYNNTLRAELSKKCCPVGDKLNLGFYAVYLRDMIRVFGRDQILPITTTEYSANMAETMNTVFNFLEMKPLSSKEMNETILSNTIRNAKPDKKPMLAETRDLLYDFYKPWNEDLARLLEDDKYLFLKS